MWLRTVCRLMPRSSAICSERAPAATLARTCCSRGDRLTVRAADAASGAEPSGTGWPAGAWLGESGVPGAGGLSNR